MSIPWAPLLVKQGDTFKRPLAITDTDDAGATIPVNLTGATLVFHLRERGGSSDVIDPAPALAITDIAGGKARLTLTKVQTAALSPATAYEYEVELTDGAGDVSTPVEGSLVVLPDRG